MQPSIAPLPKPTAQARPKLDRWLRENRVSVATFATHINVTRAAVGKWLLPFTDNNRQVPKARLMPAIHAATNGEVTPADFYPPELTGAGEQPQPMEVAR
jgi:DNA-binding transcriptional regulator YdaS (Cro superfamily)